MPVHTSGPLDDDRDGAPAPLILTALFDADTQARLEALRQAHFPPALNRVPAHLTLFHRLPGEERAALDADLAACRPDVPLAATVDGLRFLGRGVALTVTAPGLGAVRAELARRWRGRLTAQDRQGFRAHVTIQNKVAPEAARALHAELAGSFTPFAAPIVGLVLWRYLRGPWAEAGQVRF